MPLDSAYSDSISAEIVLCESLNSQVRKIRLKANAGTFPSFQAGQYLNILLPDGAQCSYSIASAPQHNHELELHIRESSEDSRSLNVMQLLRNNNHVELELPLGDCTLPQHLTANAHSPLLLLAASTGFAQAQSLVLDVLARKLPNPIHLYWGVRTKAEFYALDLLKKWKEEHPHFDYHLVVSDAQESCAWQGREGLIANAVMEDFTTLRDSCAIISGSPAMVYGTFDALQKIGLQQSNTISDVFSYAPRS